MQIENTEEFVNRLAEFSGNKLKDKKIIYDLIAGCAAAGQVELLSSASFNAKYINGLMRVLKSAQGRTDVNNLDSIKTDLSTGLEKFIGQMQDISGFLPAEISVKVNEQYLTMSHESFLRLQELLADMEWIKMYLNHLKRS